MKNNRLAVFMLLSIITQWVLITNGQELSVISCEVDIHNVGANIEINGFPFWHIALAEGKKSMTGRINHLVRNGTNTVAVSFIAGSGSEGVTNGDTGIGFSFEIVQNVLSNSTIVLTETLVSTNGVEEEASYQFTVSRHPVENLPWLLPPPVLTSADRLSISSVVVRLHAALENKDMATLKEVFLFKNEFCAISAGISLAEMEEEQTLFFTNIFGGATYSVQALDASAMTYTVKPNANLVAVNVSESSIPIAIDLGDDTTLKMPIMLSKTTNDVWVIVR